MPATPASLEPARHVLVLPEDCGCGMCTPAWMRRRGKQKRHSEPVSLADAMDREDPAAWPSMVAQHVAFLTTLANVAARVVAEELDDRLGMPDVGLPLLMFAGELAAVLQPTLHRDQLPRELVALGERAVTATTFVVSDCLAGLLDAMQALSSMAS